MRRGQLKMQLESASPEQTEELATQIGQRLKGGEVIELLSDLGGGKTTFVRGLARGLGSHDHVSSPTFKISNRYKGDSLSLFHFDLYRLTDVNIIAAELADTLDEGDCVVVVEWGELVREVLPDERLSIELIPKNENERVMNITYPASLGYILG